MKLVNSQNVNSIDDETGRTALHFAANYDLGDVVELLLKNEANVNAVDKDLNTPLHYAAKHGIYHALSVINSQIEFKSFRLKLRLRDDCKPIGGQLCKCQFAECGRTNCTSFCSDWR